MDARAREAEGHLAIKTDPRCAECNLREAATAGKAVGGRAGVAAESQGAAYVARGLAADRTPSVHLTAVHRLAALSAGGKVPFGAARARMAEAGALLEPLIGAAIDAAADPAARLAVAARWAAAATHLDPRDAGRGIDLPDAKSLVEEVKTIALGPLAVDDAAIALELLKKSRNVLFIHDGVGELAADRLLIAELLKHCRRIYSAVSGAPLGGRATIDDVHKAGIAEIANEVFAVGAGEIGMVWEEAAPELKGKLEVVDLIVSKGQANVYALHDREKEILKPMYCLFRTQCDPVAEVFGHKGRVTVLKVWK